MDALKRSLGISTTHPGSDSAPRVTSGPGDVAHRPVLMTEMMQKRSGSSPGAPPPTADVIPLTDAKDVKQKLMSVWHSVKYGKAVWSLDSKVQIAGNESPVYLLGQCYTRSHPRHNANYEEREQADAHIKMAFNLDFSSRLWFTYRREFEEFNGTSMNTDCGWGCMIRSGQMILANALVFSLLGRHWRWTEALRTREGSKENIIHRSLIRLFGDSPQTEVTPLSIHQLVAIANETLGRKPGDWFGPASTAYLLQEAVSRHQDKQDLLKNFTVYIAKDCAVFKEDVKNLCNGRDRDRWRKQKSLSKTPSLDTTEGFSMVDHPTEYPNLLVTDSAKHSEKGHLSSGLVDGVPYFEEAKEIGEEMCESATDFQLLSDETSFYSLNQPIEIDNEQWVMEGQSSQPRQQTNIQGIQPSSLIVHEQKSSSWTPVLILIPVRLGTDKLNPLYIPCLKFMLATENCVGIIGGRPKHSLYFTGFQDDNLIHLDPHLVQDHVNTFVHNFSLNSFHCKTPRKMHVSRMDPSCCIGFLCDSESNFDGWCEMMKTISVPPEGTTSYPMFEIIEGCASKNQILSSVSDMEESFKSDSGDGEDFCEDFVFI